MQARIVVSTGSQGVVHGCLEAAAADDDGVGTGGGEMTLRRGRGEGERKKVGGGRKQEQGRESRLPSYSFISLLLFPLDTCKRRLSPVKKHL